MKNLMNLMARMFSISSLLLVLGYPHAGLCIEQGQALPGLESFDRAILETIAKWDIPGASLAVAKDGRSGSPPPLPHSAPTKPFLWNTARRA